MSEMKIKEMLATAEAAANKGIPVDWRQMCYTLYSACNNYVQTLDDKFQEIAAKNHDLDTLNQGLMHKFDEANSYVETTNSAPTAPE